MHPTDKNVALISGGLKKTTNGGQAWSFSGNGYMGGRRGNTSVSAYFDPNNSARMIYFLVDSGLIVTEDSGSSWRFLNLPTIPEVNNRKTALGGAIDPNNSNTIITAIGTWSPHKYVLIRTTNGGNNASDWNTVHSAISEKFNFVDFHPQDSNYVYAGYVTTGLISKDNGQTWEVVPGNKAIRAVYKKNGDIIYAIETPTSGSSILWRSEDKGITWSNLVVNPFRGVEEIVIAPNDSNTLYAAVYNGVYKFNGSSWTEIGKKNGIPIVDTILTPSSVVVDPNNSNNMYVSLKGSGRHEESTIFRSTDSGQTWEDIGYNFEGYSGIWRLSVDPRNSDLHMTTDHGNYVLSVTASPVDTTAPSISITSPTSEDTYSISLSAISLSGTASDETAGSGLKEVTWSSSQGGSGTATLTDSTWSLSNITLVSGTNTITVTATDNSNNSSTDTLTVTYTPAQTGTIAFSQAAYSRSEGYTSATITVTRTGGSDGAASIQHSTSDGTATAGSDYTSSSSTLNWADGVLANKTLTVPIISDTIDEENETVNLTLTNATGATLGIISSTVLTINDNDNPPTVALTSTSQSKAENQGTATITLQLSSASGLEITVPFTLSGTAQTDGSDYSITPSPLTIPIGSTSTDITVTLTNDTTYETPDETLIITLGTPTNATRGSPSSHTLTITDDDPIPDTTAPSGVININSNASYTNSTNISLSLSATDTTGVTAYYLSSYNLAPEASASGWTSVTSNASYSGTISYTLSAGDGTKAIYCWYKDEAGNVSETVSDSITLDSAAPTVTISSPTSGLTLSGSVTVSVTATDSSGITGVSFKLDGSILGQEDTTIPYELSWDTTTAAKGSHSFTATATDEAGNTVTSSAVIVSVNNNHSPVLTEIGNKTIDENKELSFIIIATDQDNDNLTYTASGLPEGSSFSASTMTFTWTPSYAQAGNHKVSFRASDGELMDAEAITITVSNVNQAPELSPIGNKTVAENSNLQFTISALDPDNDQLTYYVGIFPDTSSGAIYSPPAYIIPQGASFDSETQVFSWTPDYTQAGIHGVTFNVNDGEARDSETIIITVSDVDNITPDISITSPTSDFIYATDSSIISLSGSASDDTTLSGVTWSSDKGGSGTATLTGNTWTISNITLTQGDNLITVTATDSSANTSSDTLTVTYTPITDTTLKASYSFDQSSGSTLTDSSGNNYNGTITGATWTSGKVGSGALSFNGTSDYVAIPRMNYDEITLSAWFYKNADDLTSADAIFGGWRWNSSVSLQEGLDLRFPINSPDTISIVMVTTDGTAKFSKSSYYNFGSGKANNAWHHVAVTYNKADGNQRLYVDGVLRDTDLHAAGNTIVPLAAYTDMRIGYSRVNNGYFSGMVDEVRLYDRVLSDSEVKNLYNFGSAPTVSTEAASNILSSTATLNGLVNPNGISTSAYFEYGLTCGVYGNQTSAQTLSASASNSLSTDITGLTPDASYCYRVTATNSIGTSYGQDMTFTSLPYGDTSAPTGSVRINSGAETAISNRVLLTLSATDNFKVTHYYLSESESTPLLSDSGWKEASAASANFSDYKYFYLSSGDGVKTVYAWYKDATGNISNYYSDSITLNSNDNWKNNFTVIWSGSGTETINDKIKFVKQMGYDYIALRPGEANKTRYKNNTNKSGLKFYIINPMELQGMVPMITTTDLNTTTIYTQEQKDYFNNYFVWKSTDAFPSNLATGWFTNSGKNFRVIWDIQQQSVIDYLISQIIIMIKSYEDKDVGFTFGGWMVDEPQLTGDFNYWAENKNNKTGLSYWTGEDSGLARDSIVHDYSTFSEAHATFYKQLNAALSKVWPDFKSLAEPFYLYSSANWRHDWLNGIKDRNDRNEIRFDFLMQENSGSEFVDDANIFSLGMNVTKQMVGKYPGF